MITLTIVVLPSASGLELGIPHAAIATLGVMLLLGLGFIPRPRLDTLYWALGFVITMVASFGYLAAEVSGVEIMSWLSLGLLLGAPPLTWSGMRVRRGVPPHVWVGPAVAALAMLTLVIAGDTVWYGIAYRVVFFVSSLFGVLLAREWRLLPERRELILLPAAMVSVLFTISGTANLIAGFLTGRTVGDGLGPMRTFTSVGMIIYMVCLLVSLVPLVTPSRGATRAGALAEDWHRFTTVARSRLIRAEHREELSWSLLVISLDDAIDVEVAWGTATFDRIVHGIRHRVDAVFPVEADIARRPDGTIVVLLARPESVVRELVREALRRITERTPDTALTISPSASIGWVTVSASGYDLDVLLQVASDAAARAHDAGGDRWERVA